MGEVNGNAAGNKRRFSKFNQSLMSGDPTEKESDIGAYMDLEPNQAANDTTSNDPHTSKARVEDADLAPTEDVVHANPEQERREAIEEITANEDEVDKQSQRFVASTWWSDFRDEARADRMPPVVAGDESGGVAVSQAVWDHITEWYGVKAHAPVKFTIVGGFMHKLPDAEVTPNTQIGDLVPDDPDLELYVGATWKPTLQQAAFKRLHTRRVTRATTVGEADITEGERVILVNAAPITPGTTGLNNLGNTCYMNSSLQVLTHIEELAQYFLTGEYKGDINTKNPIGHGGQVAKSFGQLITSLYCDNSSSLSPFNFKSTIGRFNRAFAGYAQQDSQEFTAFLLDGLHEDLNKVLEKPVTEKPELADDKVDDLDAINALATEVWDQNQKRNDSVIRDLFTGMYKSTLVCPVCSKVSITFDPFGDLTLPLPSSSLWLHQVTFIPLSGDVSAFEVALSPVSTIRNLKEQCGELLQTDPAKLLVGEVFNGHIFALYEDLDVVNDKIQPHDNVFVFESGTGNANEFPIFTYSKWSPPSSGFIGNPFVTMIAPEDTLETIRAKVQKRLQAFADDEEQTEFQTFKLLRYHSDMGDALLDRYLDAANLEYLDETEHLPSKENNEEHEQRLVSEADEQPASSASSDISVLSGPISEPTKNYEDATVSDSTAFPPPPQQEMAGSPADRLLLEQGDVLIVEFTIENQPYIAAAKTIENPAAKAARAQKEAKKNTTLDECLDLFAKPEVLGENDLWYCSRCKEFRQATKQMELWQVGDILTIHLKRFSDFQSYRDKISDVVEFPIEGLQMGSRIEGPHKKGLVYDLIGVDNHYGGLGGGHYTSYALNPVDKKWYYFDDSNVTPTDPQKSVTGAAYLLFYRRRSSEPLGGLRKGSLADTIRQARDEAKRAEEAKAAEARLERERAAREGEDELAGAFSSSSSSRSSSGESRAGSASSTGSSDSGGATRFPGSGNKLGAARKADAETTPLEDAPWAMVNPVDFNDDDSVN